MKKILTAILILTYTVSFSQTKKDLTEIIELVISEYKSDTIPVYHKFSNRRLISNLEKVKIKKDRDIHEKLGTNFDHVAAKIHDDTVTVTIENVKVFYYQSEKLFKKKNNKRINRYSKYSFQKHLKLPFAYISVPLISYDGKKAIVYDGYNCGTLCGNGGIFFLEKVKGKWKIIDYQRRWIS